MTMKPPNDELLNAAKDLRQGGWIVSILGAAGALCRLLLTDENIKAVVWIRRICAGGIVAVLGYFVVHGRIEPLHEAVFYSFCGTAAPELVELARRRILQNVAEQTKVRRKRP